MLDEMLTRRSLNIRLLATTDYKERKHSRRDIF